MIYNWLVIMWTRIPASCDLDIYLKHVGRYLKKKKKPQSHLQTAVSFYAHSVGFYNNSTY